MSPYSHLGENKHEDTKRCERVRMTHSLMISARFGGAVCVFNQSTSRSEVWASELLLSQLKGLQRPRTQGPPNMMRGEPLLVFSSESTLDS